MIAIYKKKYFSTVFVSFQGMKKKFFILRENSPMGLARVEYYDSEKKFHDPKGGPKRTITLNSCFSINTKPDCKNKYAIALYTKDDCFVMVAENEEDQKRWLSTMLELRSHSEDDAMVYPLFGECSIDHLSVCVAC